MSEPEKPSCATCGGSGEVTRRVVPAPDSPRRGPFFIDPQTGKRQEYPREYTEKQETVPCEACDGSGRAAEPGAQP